MRRILTAAAAIAAAIFALPVLAIQGTARLLDLCGKDGRPSFNKLVIAALLVGHLVGVDVPLGLATLLVSASFGRTVVLAFLQRTSLQATDSHAITRALTRRDPELGLEVSR